MIPLPDATDGKLKERVVLKFGEFTLDPVAKVLFRAGTPLHLTRKSTETLLVLAENSGRVLTKEEIMAAVWSDRVVDDANLAQNIAVVRKTLAAPKGTPGYIETFPGRGYRMQGPVVQAVENPTRIPSLSLPPVRKPAKLIAATAFLLVVAAAGLALWKTTKQTQSGAGESADFQVVPATRMPGREYQPALTSDGARLAFLSAAEGATPSAIRIQNLDGSGSRELSKSPGHHSSPVWSPDGTRVAYLRMLHGATDVVVTPVDGGPERILAQFPQPGYVFDHRMLDWSPDGEWLAVSTPSLELIHTVSGARRTVTTPDASISGDADPRFSPDGSRISFIRLIHRSQQEIFLADLKGSNPRQVTNFGKRISGHDWMPDGKSIVFASDRGGDFRLWRLPLRDGSPKSLGIYSEFPIELSIARRAEALVYSALHQDRNIWKLELPSLNWKRLIASSGQDASPQYSPQGDRICFRSDRSGEEQLWVADADGSNPIQITRTSLRPSVGRWSPDGSRIVFNIPQTGEIFIATLQNNGWIVQNSGAKGVHPTFSPDGQWIYAGGSSAIVRFPSTGGPASNVAATKAEALALSRDGNFLYFVREPNDRTLRRLNLQTVDLQTLGIEDVVSDLVPGCSSCYALADHGIYYLGSERLSFDNQMLYFQDLRTRKKRVVTAYPEPLWPVGSGPFSLAPDGKSLLCVRAAPSNSDVMRVTPFR